MFSINNKVLNIIYLVLLLIFVCESVYVFSFETSSKDFSYVLIFQLLFVYLISIFYSIKKFGINGVFTLFLFCLGLFNFQKFFWDSILNEDFRRAESLISINLKESVVHKTILVYCFFTQMVSWTYFSLQKRKKKLSQFTVKSDNKLYVVGLRLFYISLPFVLYKSYLEVTSLIGKSYTEYYVSDDSVAIPFYLRFSLLIFQVSFMIILASVPPIKKFRIFACFFLLTIIPYLFIGLRANFAVSVIFIFWYYTSIYKVKINYKKIVPIAFVLLIILQSISFSRSNVTKEVNIAKMVPQFLYEQSQSMYVLSLYIQYEDKIIPNRKPFILDPLFSWLYDSGQSKEVAENRDSLGHSLTYSLSSDYYLWGASLGTNAIAELFEFGILGVVVGAIFLGWFVSYFEEKIFTSRLFFFFSFGLLQYLFLLPRSSYLINVYFFVKITILYFLILFAFKLYNKKYFI